MANVTISPNMSLPVPIPLVDPGPDWATNYNSCLSIVDQHNHSPGSGVLITQSGISLMAASASYDSLNFNGTNAFEVRSVRFDAQASPLALVTDVGCLYEAGVDLYYNDGAGNQVRITSGGSVTGASGTITGLPSGTASAAYSASTFVFQSATSTAANIDGGSHIFRQTTASANGVTVSSPNSLAANYQVFWFPALPASSSFVSVDNSGNMAASIATVGGITATNIAAGTITTTQIAAGTITASNIASATITSTQIAAGGVSRSNLVAVGQQVSSSCGLFSTASSTLVDVTNLTVTITTTGRPVVVATISDGTAGNNALFSSTGTGGTPGQITIALLRAGSVIARTVSSSDLLNCTIRVPCSAVFHLDPVAAGTYTYKIQIASVTANGARAEYVKLVAYEL